MTSRDAWRPSGLPIDAVLPDILRRLRDEGRVVVHAPPGAGKTTIIPLALLDQPWRADRLIVVLEPRRLAARVAAHRMATLLGEPAGQTIGYRTRLDTRVSARTQVEVVTEGILSRMVQDDPTLETVAAVLFDEFHERSLNADLGLALVLHSRRLVRPDLRIAVMSATLDGTAVARLLDHAPVVSATGTEYPVETRYRPIAAPGQRLASHDARFTAGVSGAIRDALADSSGDVLVFLPGAPEIHRVARALEEASLPVIVDVIPLHGSLQPDEQDRAIRPSPAGRRKVVLATSIAETSLTIDGVRIVVDAGLARRQRFSPRTGMQRLETMRVTRAAADQRRGRAGRTTAGTCIRLWGNEEQGALLPFVPPEISEGDLAPLALDLAVAGIADPSALDWIDAPPAAALAQARELLRQLDAIDTKGTVTAHGREMAALGMHPRLAHMVIRAHREGLGALACDLAALLGERDPLRGQSSAGADIRERIDSLRARSRHAGVADRGAIQRINEQSRRWRRQLGVPDETANPDDAGRVLALAFPDRVAQRRPGPASRFLLRNGTGAVLPDGDPLSAESFIVIAESDGRSPESRVYLAASLSESDLRKELGNQVEAQESVAWDLERGVTARVEQRLGAIVLSSRLNAQPDPVLVASAVSDAIRRHGLDMLPWSERAERLRQRLAFLNQVDAAWPSMNDDALIASLMVAMETELGGIRSRADLQRIDLTAGLLSLLSWDQRAALDRLAPTHYVAPTGSRVPIDFADAAAPTVSIRLQEMFGCETTPTVFDGRVPVTLHLLSPAHRPVQVTRDLAGFWRTSYFDVRKDMRARYPRHSWPDDPLRATPTTRARPRG